MYVRIGNRGGFVLELLVSSAVLALTIGVAVARHKQSLGSFGEAAATDSFQQIEEELVNEVAASLGSYAKSPALFPSTDALKAQLTLALDSGVALVPLNAAPTGKLGPKASEAMERCLARPISAYAPSFPPTTSDLYFCLRIVPLPGGPIPPPDSILNMQPFIGEFYFRMEDATSGLPLAFVDLAPNIGRAIGHLYYSLYWTAPGNVFKTYANTYALSKIQSLP